MAQEFDTKKLRLLGPPRTVVNHIGGPGGGGGLSHAAVSPGGILVYGVLNLGRFVWMDRTGKIIEALTEPETYQDFRLSSDSKHFVAMRGLGAGHNDFWLMDIERRVLSLFSSSRVGPSYLGTAVWSKDSRSVLFNKARIVYRRNIERVSDEERVGEWNGFRRLCDWSRDGRFVLYETADPETKRDLWIVPVTPDGKPV
jgi:hypothetical protein